MKQTFTQCIHALYLKLCNLIKIISLIYVTSKLRNIIIYWNNNKISIAVLKLKKKKMLLNPSYQKSLSKSSVCLARVYSSTFSYKSLPDESRKAIDRMIRVDHAGKIIINKDLYFFGIGFFKTSCWISSLRWIRRRSDLRGSDGSFGRHAHWCHYQTHVGAGEGSLERVRATYPTIQSTTFASTPLLECSWIRFRYTRCFRSWFLFEWH